MLTQKRGLLKGPVALGADTPVDIFSPPAGVGGGAALTPMGVGGKAGCSLVSKSMASGIILWWLIFTAPVVLVLARIRKKD